MVKINVWKMMVVHLWQSVEVQLDKCILQLQQNDYVMFESVRDYMNKIMHIHGIVLSEIVDCLVVLQGIRLILDVYLLIR